MIDPLRSKATSPETASSPRAAEGPELDEAPQRFAYEKRAIEKLIEALDRNGASKNTRDRLSMVQGQLNPVAERHQPPAAGDEHNEIKTLRLQLGRFGNTDIVGFSRFDCAKMPPRFSHRRYSIDTMLPVIDLHAYGNDYPESSLVQGLSILQHVSGWWWFRC